PRPGLRHGPSPRRPAGAAARGCARGRRAARSGAAALPARTRTPAAPLRRRLQPREPRGAVPHRARSAREAGMSGLDTRAADLRQAFDAGFALAPIVEERPPHDLLAVTVGGDPYLIAMRDV